MLKKIKEAIVNTDYKGRKRINIKEAIKGDYIYIIDGVVPSSTYGVGGRYNLIGFKLPTNVIKLSKVKNYMDYIHMDYKTKNGEVSVCVSHKLIAYKANEKDIKDYNDEIEKAYIKNISGMMINHRKVSSNGGAMNIGTDPEIFVNDKDGNNLPAFKFLGSVINPSKGPNLTYGRNRIFWDGFQAEFDTTPNTCMSYVFDSIQRGLSGVLEHARKVDSKATLSMDSVIQVTQETLDATSKEHKEFGCAPSLNAYEEGETKENLDGNITLVRPAGGHIHFGYKDTKESYKETVKVLDAILGVACVAMFREYDNPMRRMLYGKAGEYRLPAHGLEYRVLSNAWLCHPLITNIVFDLARKCICLHKDGMFKLWKHDEQETIRIINDCDYKGAMKILSKNRHVFKELLKASHLEPRGVNARYVMFFRGCHNFLKNPRDIESNWNIGYKWITHCDGANKNWGMTRNKISPLLKDKTKVA